VQSRLVWKQTSGDPSSQTYNYHGKTWRRDSFTIYDVVIHGGDSPFLVTCGDYRKRHQPTPHYAWLWTLAQAVNRTSGRSGSSSEDDPAERGCSRSRTTLGSTPTTPGGSHMEGATTRGRLSVPLTDWLTFTVARVVAMLLNIYYTVKIKNK